MSIDWSRVSKLVGMLGSSHDGERVNAARLLERTLDKEGGSFGDLSERIANGGHAQPRTIIIERRAEPNPAGDIARKILDKASGHMLRAERRFLRSILNAVLMCNGEYSLSQRQADWLSALEVRYLSSGPKMRMNRTVKPGPVPKEMIDELGLGDEQPMREDPPRPPPRPYKPAPMPQFTLDELGLSDLPPEPERVKDITDFVGAFRATIAGEPARDYDAKVKPNPQTVPHVEDAEYRGDFLRDKYDFVDDSDFTDKDT